jgi:predicted dehydrogenase
VTSGFHFAGDAEFLASNIRMDAALEPLGALGDLGWYNVRLALFAFRYELPQRVSAVTHRVMNGVPTELTATLYFADGRLSTFDCGFQTAFRQWAEIVGTNGVVRLDDFCICESGEEARFQTVWQAGLNENHTRVQDKRTETVVRHCCQEANMWTRFGRLVQRRKGLLPAAPAADSGPEESGAFWQEVTLKTQLLMDALYDSAMRKDGAVVTVDAASIAL